MHWLHWLLPWLSLKLTVYYNLFYGSFCAILHCNVFSCSSHVAVQSVITLFDSVHQFVMFSTSVLIIAVFHSCFLVMIIFISESNTSEWMNLIPFLAGGGVLAVSSGCSRLIPLCCTPSEQDCMSTVPGLMRLPQSVTHPGQPRSQHADFQHNKVELLPLWSITSLCCARVKPGRTQLLTDISSCWQEMWLHWYFAR